MGPLFSNRLRRRIAPAMALATAVCLAIRPSSPAASTPDEVLNWNTIATTLGPATGINGVLQSRIYAMTQLAVHDALNAIEHRYEPYTYTQEENPGASPSAAVATAAHDVLVHELPTQVVALDAAWAASLAA